MHVWTEMGDTVANYLHFCFVFFLALLLVYHLFEIHEWANFADAI